MTTRSTRQLLSELAVATAYQDVVLAAAIRAELADPARLAFYGVQPPTPTPPPVQPSPERTHPRMTALTATLHLLFLIGEIRLKHLLFAALVPVAIALTIGLLLTWYAPIALVAFVGRRAGIWTFHPF